MTRTCSKPCPRVSLQSWPTVPWPDVPLVPDGLLIAVYCCKGVMHVGHEFGAKQLDLAKPIDNGSTASQVHCGPPTSPATRNQFISL